MDDYEDNNHNDYDNYNKTNCDNDNIDDDDIVSNKLFDINAVENKNLYRTDEDDNFYDCSNIFDRINDYNDIDTIFDNDDHSIFGDDYNIRFNIANYNSIQINNDDDNNDEMILDI